MAGMFHKLKMAYKSFSGSSSAPSDNRPSINIMRSLLLSHTLNFSPKQAYLYYDSTTPLASAVDRISDAFAELEPALFDRETGEYLNSSDPIAADILNLLNRPGFGQSYSQMANDAGVSFLLTRDQFTVLHGNIKFAPSAMGVAKPFNVTEMQASDGYVGSYTVTMDGGSIGAKIFTREKPVEFRFTDGKFLELCHTKGKTRDDGMRGRSPVAAILWNILSVVQGGEHNAMFLQNGATPSGALTSESEQPLTDDQFTRLKEQIDTQYSGPANAGRPLLLEGGLKWQGMTISNKDMELIKMMAFMSEGISERYNIPLALVTNTALTKDNATTAIVSLFDDAVLPLANSVFKGWEMCIFPRFGIDESRYSLKPNPASIRSNMIKVAEKIERWAKTGAVTDNEIRQEIGKEPLEGGDVIYKTMNMVPVGEDVVTSDQDDKAKLVKMGIEGGMTEKAANDWAEKIYGD